MQQIGKRLTSFVWYAAPLTLSNAFDWKGRIKVLRKINPAGAGYLSFDPARPGNSLTTLNTFDVVTLDATGIVTSDPGTYFFLDNGEQPLPRDAPDTMAFEFEPGPARVLEYVPLRAGQRCYPILYQGWPGAVEFSVNGGPYVEYGTAGQQVEALPDADFGPSGSGLTLGVRIAVPESQDTEYLNISLNY